MRVRFAILALAAVCTSCSNDWTVIHSPEGWQAMFPRKPVQTKTRWRFGHEFVELPSYHLFPPESMLRALIAPGIYVAGGWNVPVDVGRQDVVTSAMTSFAEAWSEVVGTRIVKRSAASPAPTIHDLVVTFEDDRRLRLRVICPTARRIVFAAAARAGTDGERFLRSLQVAR